MMLPDLTYKGEVFHTHETLLKVCASDIAILKEKAMANDRKRIRLCCHRNVSDSLHEMLIIHVKDAYVRPHKHLNKSESLHILEGSADVVLFDEYGLVTKVISVGEFSSGRKFYYRMVTPHYHTLIIHSDFLVFHETTKGPFEKSDTILAPWAPQEDNAASCQAYRENLIKHIGRNA